MTKKVLKQIICSKKRCMSELTFKKHYIDLYNDMMSWKFPEKFTYFQKIYHYLHDDKELLLGICPTCGNRCKFVGFQFGYHKHCCTRCSTLDPNVKEKTKTTNLNLYGVENVYQSKEIKIKIKHTKKERYNDENYTNREKFKQTCLEKYDVENPQQIDSVKEKTKRTNKEKYGVEYVSQSNEVKNKIKQTCLEKYGVESPMQSKQIQEKFKKTCLTKYGVSNPNQLNTVKEKKKQTCQKHYAVDWPMQSKENLKKAKIAYYKKFGVENPSQSEQIKEKKKQTVLERYGVEHISQISKTSLNDNNLSDKQKQNILSFIEKRKMYYDQIYNEYIKNGLTPKGGMSKTELETYKFLLTLFDSNDIYPQYFSDLYPYHCDFYIKSLNLYIELNGHWTHGKHPFDINNENDKKTIELWKSKKSKYYEIAINVWTHMDVAKRNVAHKNGINYLEIFSNDTNIIKNEILNYLR